MKLKTSSSVASFQKRRKMKMKFAIFLLSGVLAFSQTTTTTTPSTSTSTANAIVYTGGGNGGNGGAASAGEFRQYPSPYNAVGTPALPGYPVSNSPWGVLYFKVWDNQTITSEQQTQWLQPLLKDKRRVKGVQIGGMKGSYPKNTDPIVLLPWNPEMIANPGDLIIGRTVYVCQPDDVIENCYGLALGVAKETFGMRRASILFQNRNENVTKGKASAFGASVGGMLPNGTAAASLGLGVSRGQTVTRVNGYLAIQVICMNDVQAGTPINIIQRIPPMTIPNGNQERQIQAQPQQPVSADPAFRDLVGQVSKLTELVTQVVLKQQAPQTPVAPAPISQVPAPQASNTCSGIPQLQVYFGFEKSNIERGLQRGDYEASMNALVAWAKTNPSCTLEVEGHTCKIGSKNYNLILGDHRAEALYRLLIEKGVPRTQLQQASFGKGKPSGSERLDDDRRAFVHVRGDASGK